MGSRRPVAVVVGLAFLLSLALSASAARASVLYWDANSTLGIQPGNGCWDTDGYWAAATTGIGRGGWQSGFDANFYAPSSPTSTITIASSVSVGNITFTGSGYTVTGGTLNFSSGTSTITASQNATINSQITGTGAVATAGAGVLAINGTSNTYSGGTIVNSGTLSLGQGGNTTGGGTSYSNVGLGMVTVNAGGTLIGQAYATGRGYNTVAAPMTINGGLVTANAAISGSAASALYATGLTMAGGTINGDKFAIGGSVTVTASSVISATDLMLVYTMGPRGGDFNVGPDAQLVVNSSMYGWGAGTPFVKNGDGTLVFNGAVAVDTTTINAGTLAVNNSLTCGSLGVTVNASGTLSGSGTIAAKLPVDVAAGGTIAPGFNGAGTLTTATSSAVTLETGSTLAYTLGSPDDSFLAVGGNLTLSSGLTLDITPGTHWGGGVYPLASFASLTDNSNSFNGWTVNVTGLPTPSYTLVINGNVLDLDVSGPVVTLSGTWNAAGAGNWSAAGKWLNGVVPGGNGDSALFGTSTGTSAFDRHAGRPPPDEQLDVQHHGRRQLHDHGHQHDDVDEHLRQPGAGDRLRRQPHHQHADRAGRRPELLRQLRRQPGDLRFARRERQQGGGRQRFGDAQPHQFPEQLQRRHDHQRRHALDQRRPRTSAPPAVC